MTPYKDMIKGMLMDTPGHEIFQSRYETWEDLELYCYRVAGTVGLMTRVYAARTHVHTIKSKWS